MLWLPLEGTYHDFLRIEGYMRPVQPRIVRQRLIDTIRQIQVLLRELHRLPLVHQLQGVMEERRKDQGEDL